jgi:hypothetical protein
MGHGQKEPANSASRIHHHGEVRNAAERLASCLDLVEVGVGKTDIFRFRTFASAATLDGNAHNFVRVRVPCDNIDSGVVNKSTFKPVF